MDDVVRWPPGPNGERAIACTTAVNPTECLVILLMLDLLDTMPLWERQAFLERGAVYDTPSGRTLLASVREVHARHPEMGVLKTEH